MSARNRPRPSFSPDEVNPSAPTLHVVRNGNGWELRSPDRVIGSYEERTAALDAALEISKQGYSEIFYESMNGKHLHLAEQDEMMLRFREILRRYQQLNGVNEGEA